jgi:hypothetical protein
MRLSIFIAHLLRGITTISLALAEPSEYFNQNNQNIIDTKRIVVPGPNPIGSYYCGPDPKDQLFRISQMTVAPFPIPVQVLALSQYHFLQLIKSRDETVFVKIQGTAPSDPDLIFARLNVTVQINDCEPGWHEERLWQYPLTAIGYRTIYGLPLQGGPFPVDLVASHEFPSYFFCDGHYTLKAEAKLDTGKVLFCVVSEFDLPGKGSCRREEFTVERVLGLEERGRLVW